MDIDKLRREIADFVRFSTPIGGQNDPCTVGDMQTLVRNLARVLNSFVAEMENEEK